MIQLYKRSGCLQVPNKAGLLRTYSIVADLWGWIVVVVVEGRRCTLENSVQGSQQVVGLAIPRVCVVERGLQ